jgi:hypothetical protein
MLPHPHSKPHLKAHTSSRPSIHLFTPGNYQTTLITHTHTPRSISTSSITILYHYQKKAVMRCAHRVQRGEDAGMAIANKLRHISYRASRNKRSRDGGPIMDARSLLKDHQILYRGCTSHSTRMTQLHGYLRQNKF